MQEGREERMQRLHPESASKSEREGKQAGFISHLCLTPSSVVVLDYKISRKTESKSEAA